MRTAKRRSSQASTGWQSSRRRRAGTALTLVWIGASSPKTANFEAVNEVQLGFYAAGSIFIGYQACAMLATNWLIDKACNMPARDAVRNGYLLTCGSDEVSARLMAGDKKHAVKRHLRELVHFGRVYGGRLVPFVVDSANPEEYYKAPFNLDGVQRGMYRGMSQIDPNWVTPVLTEDNLNDPASPNYYEPTFWKIKDRLYHKSHLRIFVPYPVPDFLKPHYRYLGVSVPQRMVERAYAAERSANEGPQLLMTKRLTSVGVGEGALNNREKLEENLADWVSYRDNYGVRVGGADETIQQFDTALGDVDTVIMTQYQLAAAVANVPATKLLQTQPKGFNAAGEYERSVYREDLESIQSNDMSPLLETHYRLMAKSEGIPLPAEIAIQCMPVDSPTAKEWAEIDKIKADRDAALFNTGAIDEKDIRNHVQTVEQIRNTSEALGVAIEDVDAFGKAIERMGGDAQGARDSLTDMAESIGEALQDVESGRAKTFKALGISLKDVDGQAKNAVQGMVELAGAVVGLGREQAVFQIKELGITDERPAPGAGERLRARGRPGAAGGQGHPVERLEPVPAAGRRCAGMRGRAGRAGGVGRFVEDARRPTFPDPSELEGAAMIDLAKIAAGLAGWKGYAAAAGLALAIGAGSAGPVAWVAQGWRKDARIADIERAHAEGRDAEAQAALAAVEAARTEERRRTAAVERQRDDAQRMAAVAVGDAARAGAERRGLLKRADALVASAINRDPALAVGSPAGVDAVELLAYMPGRVSGRAAKLAEVADQARLAGLTCERTYDAVRGEAGPLL